METLLKFYVCGGGILVILAALAIWLYNIYENSGIIALLISLFILSLPAAAFLLVIGR